ncbi:alanine/glycine:cation symporter family protein [Bacillus xiamenensis]|uniref:Sodium:alanine symporter family protein n=1 Tax=Bacillus xiamenensis TaxID=1178537 RepID=A0ABT4F3I5_9BACI|nr:sodium:alanine symporter family protein [Bacillus xiamenensis]EKF35809.1 AGCS family alanine or glycine:sodium (Na+) or proton (H+) symporter [Bacillus xiamenensis]MBG9911608.1 transporter [Bacillus xiamenensis]MCW1836614.1 sodium:alanine symporter family protein [Bacillus xiamenensis]MCY9576620.1 sodium:alanine symporter family protein [Bacillus xiamenensis]
MGWVEQFVSRINDVLWGPPLLLFIVGTGIYLTFRVLFIQIRLLPYSLKLAFSKQDKTSEGDISHFQALMTALAATVGTGNIVGVASAVIAGGPGAVFWMWFAAFFGMATKYAEAVLAVRYRVKNEKGEMSGGPMYYLEHGLKQKWLGVLFAVFGASAAFGIGNLVQSNSISGVMYSTFHIPTWVTGIIITAFTALVILGGIKSIGRVTAIFVPVMALFYVICGLIILVMNADLVPSAVGLIFSDAFTGQAVAGGAIGTVIRWGVARGVFSNEAGLGSSPIAAAAAKTDMPARQALVSMTQVFIDTMIVCSITGITIVMANMYQSGSSDALTSVSFSYFLGPIGSIIVAIGLLLFAYSTIIGWSYYGEKCFTYLVKDSHVMYYRILFVIAVFFGAVFKNDFVWGLADMLNGLMAIPNLIGLIGLSGVVVFESKRIIDKIKQEKKEKNISVSS